MAITNRIYKVTTIGNADRKNRLVRAPSAIQAWRRVAEELITVDLATQDDLVELASAGVKVEDSKAPPAA